MKDSKSTIRPVNVEFKRSSNNQQSVLNKPFIESYRIHFSHDFKSFDKIQTLCSETLVKASSYFDVDHIILGHIKGILELEKSKISYSVTHAETVEKQVILFENGTSPFLDKRPQFKFDILSYTAPKSGYLEFKSSLSRKFESIGAEMTLLKAE